MLTFTQAYTRTADITGVGSDATSITNFKQDVNQGLRIFKNGARRYFSRVEKTADLVASQKSYSLPEDCVRITTAKVSANGFVYPLTEISSESKWNALNMIPTVTLNVPQYFFVKGRNQIEVWPTPSSNVTGGLIVSYEPRMFDMSLDDVTTGTISVTNGSTTITGSGTGWTASVVNSFISATDGSDGYWYKVTVFNSATSITIEQPYQGPTGTTKAYILGDVPDIPEDFHMAVVYYACYNFYLKRKDIQVANSYLSQFNVMMQQYKAIYSSKTTGIVQAGSANNQAFSLFNLPPNPIS